MNRTVTQGILATVVALAGVALLASPARAQGRRCLAPSGVDDTERLQSALERCSGAESWCVVRLCRGVFRTAPLRVGDFRGVLRGARRGRTVIQALPELLVSTNDPYWQYKPLDPDLDPWPFLLQFIGGRGAIRNLTIEIPTPAPGKRPTQGWTETLGKTFEVAGAILITGRDPVAFEVNRVRVVAGQDPASGLNTTLFAGVSFRGLIHNPSDPDQEGFPVYPVTGQLRISESELTGMWSGTQLWELDGAQVEVTQNNIRSGLAVDVIDGSRSRVRVDDNRWDASFVGVQVILNLDGEPSVDNTFLVTRNRGRVGPYDGWGSGVYFVDPWSLPEPGDSALRVTRNVLTLGTGDEAAASAVEAYGAGQLRAYGNRFRGRTGAGIRVDQTSGCRIAWNDLGGLDTGGGPHLELGLETSECLAVVGRDDIVHNYGIDNRILLR